MTTSTKTTCPLCNNSFSVSQAKHLAFCTAAKHGHSYNGLCGVCASDDCRLSQAAAEERSGKAGF